MIIETLKSKSKSKDKIFSDRNVYRNSDLLRIKLYYEILPNNNTIADVIAVEWAEYMQLPPRSVNDFIYRFPLLILKSLYDNLEADTSGESLHFVSKFIADYMGFSPNFTFYFFE